MNKIFIVFSAIFLIYMVWPGPSKISDFKALPDSFKSTLSGDTTQIPNVSAYFSNHFRNYATDFYKKNYQQNFRFPTEPIIINHAPERAWIAIKKHTDSTYLEEYVYPMRDSLYVNGLEFFYEDGTPRFWGSSLFNEGGKNWYTKVTLRYYPSNIFIRIIVWFASVLSIVFLFRLYKKVIKE
jgi:hypothetical protein